MLEIALNQVDSYCSKQGLIIAGYYQANEHIDRYHWLLPIILKGFFVSQHIVFGSL
jgi:hypothetical protein